MEEFAMQGPWILWHGCDDRRRCDYLCYFTAHSSVVLYCLTEELYLNYPVQSHSRKKQGRLNGMQEIYFLSSRTSREYS
jgi:hypothetical protein